MQWCTEGCEMEEWSKNRVGAKCNGVVDIQVRHSVTDPSQMEIRLNLDSFMWLRVTI